ncbi:Methionine aminopeptidase 1B, chloroplastic OS=Arabidopsis thaliana GN=MAP1B PE=2 SV=2 [Rhizoctonia solani AG-1 IB]|uniref:Methionine aminopeptidase n=1 Tax=Thanatephorus cucumeris (strain AG1-IB / isolate 7/3/14) TaxID=1108050 RepID=A0A0B7FTP9_THACB|nr:Methionine aminopeptidase 1B, chloroplastic OS=Arabidopsis thaliana GN=MAP1B PE=2 SV=2 [Rhizoctonia solani AG-1 IB]
MISSVFSRRLFQFGSCIVRDNATPWIRPNVSRLASTIPTSKHADDSEDLAEKIRVFGTYIPVLSENPLQQGTSHIPRKIVPAHIARPAYAHPNYRASKPPPYRGDGLIKLGTVDELKARRVGALAAMALQKAQSLVKPGITSEEIDDEVHDFILSHGAYPSPLNYPSPEGSYPKSTCISVNNCIIHGIPDTRELEDGDLLNIDITVYLDGFHGDTSNTFLVGDVDRQGQYITQLAERALNAGISVCKPGAYFKDIAKAICNVVQDAEEETGEPYVISPHFTGHGIGKDFHRPPWIVHTKNEEPGMMKPGHCFTVEPAIIQGTDPDWWMLPDGWTILSESYARATQAEHTILITETGADILTDRETAKATFDKYKS